MNRTCSALVTLILGAALQSAAQSTNSIVAPPANAWMLQAAPQPMDGVSAQLRSARDQYFDSVFGLTAPINPNPAQASHIAESPAASDITKTPEMPKNPNRAVVSATFESFQTFVSQSQQSIYSEVSFLLNGVFQDGRNVLSSGNTITVIIPGGTATTSTGTLSYLADAKDLFIQPNGKYLLVLSYNSTGQFYTLIKDWQLVNGVVKANSRIEQLRAAAGQSVLVDTNATQLNTTTLTPLLTPATN